MADLETPPTSADLSDDDKLAMALIALATTGVGGLVGGRTGAMSGAVAGGKGAGMVAQDAADKEKKAKEIEQTAKAQEAASKRRIEEGVEIVKQTTPLKADKTDTYVDTKGNKRQGLLGPDGRVVQDLTKDPIVEPPKPEKPEAAPSTQLSDYTDKDGNPLAFNPKTKTFEPVVSPPGAKKNEKEPVPSQFQAATFGRRLEQSEQVFEDLTAGGYNRSAYDEAIIGKILSGTGLDAIKDENMRRQAQAERNFVNAVLRRESGAAISKPEFDSAENQYFPRAGDSAELAATKKANRDQVASGLRAEAGGAWARVPLIDAVPKIKVINKETGEILAIQRKDLADAIKDGFEEVK